MLCVFAFPPPARVRRCATRGAAALSGTARGRTATRRRGGRSTPRRRSASATATRTTTARGSWTSPTSRSTSRRSRSAESSTRRTGGTTRPVRAVFLTPRPRIAPHFPFSHRTGGTTRPVSAVPPPPHGCLFSRVVWPSVGHCVFHTPDRRSALASTGEFSHARPRIGPRAFPPGKAV